MAAIASRAVAELRSAPDDTIGDAAARAKLPQAMQLEMDADMIEKLLASARRGKPAQLVFGRNPLLRFAGQSHVLSTRASSEYHELYQCSPDRSHKDWSFHGLVSHRLRLEVANNSMEGMDAALEELKNNMATIQQETEARKTVITPVLPAIKRGRTLVVKKAQPPAKFLSPNLQATSSHSTPRVSTPTLLSETQGRNEAIKYALIHLLAIKPLSIGECAATIHARTSMVQPVLERIAEKESSGDWRLSKKCYKDLDVWGFPYRSTADREDVIENAIYAYDAQRIDPKDNLWQFLLPPQDRFKGKTLSKLKLQQPTAGTPLAKPKVLEKRTASSRQDPKKAKDSSDAKKVAKTSSSDSPSTVKSAKDKVVRRDGEAAKTASGTKNGKAGETVREADTAKKAKAGPAPKTASSKPKTPSPLSSSPPVNASDFEGGHPVHKVLSGSPSPTKRPADNKRKAAADEGKLAAAKRVRSSSDSEDSRPLRKFLPAERQPVKRAAADERNGSPATAKVRLDGHEAGAPARKPLPAPRSSSQPAKRKVDDDDSSSLDSAPLKTRRLLAHGATGAVRKVSTATTAAPDAAQRKKLATGPSGSSRSAQAPPSRPAAHTDSSNSGGTSPEEQLSRRQGMELASNFRRFYKTYEQLYTEISGAVEPPSKERLDELLRMHASLEDMKRMLADVPHRI